MQKKKSVRWRIICNSCGQVIGTVGSVTVPIDSAEADFEYHDGGRINPHMPWCGWCNKTLGDFTVRRG